MNKPAAKNNRYCRNCYYPLPSRAGFCPHCGQKFTTGKLTVKELLNEFADAIFNVDSKIFRTIGALFIPGKLTNAYFQGKHKRYVHPLRIFLVTAVLHFAVMGLVLYQPFHDAFGEVTDTMVRRGVRAELFEDVAKAKSQVALKMRDDPSAIRALDSLMVKVPGAKSDSVDYGYLAIQEDWSINTKQVRFADRDMAMLKSSDLMKLYKVDGFWSQLQVRQMVRINKEGGNFAQFVLGKLIWMVVLMMPALALVLKLLYFRRKRYYVEHLVFSFHYHAFAFVIAALGLLGVYFVMNKGDEAPNAIMTFAFLIILIYLYKAMRNVYHQGRFKTFIKLNILNFTYTFIFILFLLLTFVVSAFLF